MEYRNQLCCDILIRNVRIFFFWLFFVSCAGDAWAGLAEISGFGIRSNSLAGACVAMGTDPSVAYYNPSGLTRLSFSEDLGFNIQSGMTFFDTQAFTEHSVLGKNNRTELHPAKDLNLDIGVDLGRHLQDIIGKRNFVLGFSAMIPVDNLYWWRSHFPGDERYTFYYDDIHRAIIITGLGLDILPWLSIGISANITLALNTDTSGPVYLADENINTIITGLVGNGSDTYVTVHGELGADQKTTVHMAPIIGLQLKPMNEITIGLTYRGKLFIDNYGNNEIRIETDSDSDLRLEIPFVYPHNYVHYYTPDQLALGISYQLTNSLIITADITLMQWSTYLNYVNEIPQLPFNDVYLPRIGVEKSIFKGSLVAGDFFENIILRAGYGYWRSPIPDQSETTNELDNDKHILSVGCELGLERVGKMVKKPTSIQTMFQYHSFIDRSYIKRETGDNFKLGGFAYTGGLAMEVKF